MKAFSHLALCISKLTINLKISIFNADLIINKH